MSGISKDIEHFLKRFHPPITVGLILIPKFTVLPVMAMIEAMRQANIVSGENLFSWTLFHIDSPEVMSSSGIKIMADRHIDDADANINFVCGGITAHEYESDVLSKKLKNLVTNHCAIGALCTGTYVLARAGLVDGYHCTIHWWNIATLASSYPKTIVSPDLFVVDRDRVTCSGGIAPVHLILHITAILKSYEIAVRIGNHLLLDRFKNEDLEQPLSSEYYWYSGDAPMMKVVHAMELNIKSPLSLIEVAKYAKISTRQVERRFKSHFQTSPMLFYRRVRLRNARRMIMYTGRKIQEISVECGFTSSSNFTRYYKEYFGLTPQQDRKTLPRLFDLDGQINVVHTKAII